MKRLYVIEVQDKKTKKWKMYLDGLYHSTNKNAAELAAKKLQIETGLKLKPMEYCPK